MRTSPIALVGPQGLLNQIRRVGWHRQDAQRVRVPEAALPALHSNDSGIGLDDIECKRIPETKPDTVVDL